MSAQPFKLEHLFGSKTRARLLGLFLENPKQSYFVRELTRKIDAQLNSVRRELKNLVELGLVIEKRGTGSVGAKSLADKKKYYAANADCMLYEDLRALFKKFQILLKQSLVQEIDASGDIHFLAFTGKFVDKTEMPTDILIIGSIDTKKLKNLVGQFETEMGDEINFTLMPKDEYLYRKQVTDRFLFSILEGEKVVMIDKLPA